MKKSYFRRLVSLILCFSMLLPTVSTFAYVPETSVELDEYEWRDVDGQEIGKEAGVTYRVKFVKKPGYTYITEVLPSSTVDYDVIPAVYENVDRTVHHAGYWQYNVPYQTTERYQSGTKRIKISDGYYKTVKKSRTVKELQGYDIVVVKAAYTERWTEEVRVYGTITPGYYKEERYRKKAGYYKTVTFYNWDGTKITEKQWVPPVYGTREVWVDPVKGWYTETRQRSKYHPEETKSVPVYKDVIEYYDSQVWVPAEYATVPTYSTRTVTKYKNVWHDAYDTTVTDRVLKENEKYEVTVPPKWERDDSTAYIKNTYDVWLNGSKTTGYISNGVKKSISGSVLGQYDIMLIDGIYYVEGGGSYSTSQLDPSVYYASGRRYLTEAQRTNEYNRISDEIQTVGMRQLLDNLEIARASGFDSLVSQIENRINTIKTDDIWDKTGQKHSGYVLDGTTYLMDDSPIDSGWIVYHVGKYFERGYGEIDFEPAVYEGSNGAYRTQAEQDAAENNNPDDGSSDNGSSDGGTDNGTADNSYIDPTILKTDGQANIIWSPEGVEHTGYLLNGLTYHEDGYRLRTGWISYAGGRYYQMQANGVGKEVKFNTETGEVSEISSGNGSSDGGDSGSGSSDGGNDNGSTDNDAGDDSSGNNGDLPQAEIARLIDEIREIDKSTSKGNKSLVDYYNNYKGYPEIVSAINEMGVYYYYNSFTNEYFGGNIPQLEHRDYIISDEDHYLQWLSETTNPYLKAPSDEKIYTVTKKGKEHKVVYVAKDGIVTERISTCYMIPTLGEYVTKEEYERYQELNDLDIYKFVTGLFKGAYEGVKEEVFEVVNVTKAVIGNFGSALSKVWKWIQGAFEFVVNIPGYIEDFTLPEVSVNELADDMHIVLTSLGNSLSDLDEGDLGVGIGFIIGSIIGNKIKGPLGALANKLLPEDSIMTKIIKGFGNISDAVFETVNKAIGRIIDKIASIFKKSPTVSKDNMLNVLSPNGCFVAGTKVKTPDGYKNIEDFKIGDLVYSKNIETNEIEIKTVYTTFVGRKIDIYEINIAGNVLRATEEHPFWIVDKGWVEAKDLKVDDLVLDFYGIEQNISSILVHETEGTTIYNISVLDNHNYFVGNDDILTHNKSCEILTDLIDNAGNVDSDKLKTYLNAITDSNLNDKDVEGLYGILKAQKNITDTEVLNYIDDLEDLVNWKSTRNRLIDDGFTTQEQMDKARELLNEGKTPDEVIDFFKGTGNLTSKLDNIVDGSGALNQGVVDDIVDDVTDMANRGELPDETVNEVLDKLEGQNNPELADEILDVQEAAETFMDGNQYTKVDRLKTLKPDITYQTPGGHLYKTDSLGRIDSVEGTLESVTASRSTYSQRVAGRGDRLPTDDGGHLIASQFNGSGGLDNLVPMDSTLNRAGGDWYKMEQEWAEALADGSTVDVNINVVYEGASQRPKEFVVKYTIDGDVTVKTWQNTIGGN